MNDTLDVLLHEGIRLEGFYKLGTILLKRDAKGSLIAEARYDQVTPVDCFDDLVRLNHTWWILSRNRFEGWKTPNPFYAAHFKRLNLEE